MPLGDYRQRRTKKVDTAATRQQDVTKKRSQTAQQQWAYPFDERDGRLNRLGVNPNAARQGLYATMGLFQRDKRQKVTPRCRYDPNP